MEGSEQVNFKVEILVIMRAGLEGGFEGPGGMSQWIASNEVTSAMGCLLSFVNEINLQLSGNRRGPPRILSLDQYLKYYLTHELPMFSKATSRNSNSPIHSDSFANFLGELSGNRPPKFQVATMHRVYCHKWVSQNKEKFTNPTLKAFMIQGTSSNSFCKLHNKFSMKLRATSNFPSTLNVVIRSFPQHPSTPSPCDLSWWPQNCFACHSPQLKTSRKAANNKAIVSFPPRFKEMPEILWMKLRSQAASKCDEREA